MSISENSIINDFLNNRKHLNNNNYLEVLRLFESEDQLIIDNPKLLPLFLEAVSKSHPWYHHYTTLESLEKILKYKTFKMTRGVSKRLNDLHEPEFKGDKEIWKKTFITCFNYSGEDKNNRNFEENINYRKEENMAMWLLYGKPQNEGIRISFPKETFLALSDSNCKLKDKGEKISDDKVKIITTDIFYAKGNDSEIEPDPDYQSHRNKKVKFNINEKLFYYLKKKEFTGYVKNYAWRYEDEVRIIARINQEYNLKKDVECIYLNIPEELLNTFKITTGPYFTKFYELEKILDEYPNITRTESLLKGKVNFNDDYEVIGETVVDLVNRIKKLTKRRKNE